MILSGIIAYQENMSILPLTKMAILNNSSIVISTSGNLQLNPLPGCPDSLRLAILVKKFLLDIFSTFLLAYPFSLSIISSLCKIRRKREIVTDVLIARTELII